MEGKKSIKDLKARLGVGKENNAAGALVPPPGGPPHLLPPTGATPLVPPPGSNMPVPAPEAAPPLVLPPGAAPLVPPPGVSLPQAPTAQAYVPEPEPAGPVQAKRLVIKGKIDDETASLAGLDKFRLVKKILVALLPGLVFVYFGSQIGSIWFRSEVQELKRTEIETLRKRVLAQNDAVNKLTKNIAGVIGTKMKSLSPDKAATDAAAIIKANNPASFFPEDGLFLATTPFIDNGKKDTDRRYLGPTLDYLDSVAMFLVQAQLHAERTNGNKDKLQTGFDTIMRRIKELSGDQEINPSIGNVIADLGKLTGPPHAGFFGLELLEGNKGRLVVILDTETATPADGGKPVISKYTVYDAKFGATPPPEKDKANAPRVLDKTQVAAIDPTTARVLLLSRDTLAVESYFLALFRLGKIATDRIIPRAERSSETLTEAYTAPLPGHGEPSAAPTKKSTPKEEVKEEKKEETLPGLPTEEVP